MARKEPPVVAELGRPETPQERAERLANARRERKSRQTARNLVGATIASLLLAGFVGVLMSNAPEQAVREVDYGAVASAAQPSTDTELLVPELSDEWIANRAELERGADDVLVWRIGFVTPSVSFVTMLQGVDANPTWLASRVENRSATDTVTLDGVEWQLYDRRDDDEAGNLEFAMSTVVGDSTFVLYGTAPDAEFSTIASQVAALEAADD